LRQSGPNDEAAEKTNPAAQLLEFAVHAGGRFVETIPIDEHGQAGESRAISADGDGVIEAEFLSYPIRIALGNIIGSEGHGRPPGLPGKTKGR
jgi:hypothetical protein